MADAEMREVRTILVGTDLGEEGVAAATLAGELGRRLGATVHLAHVVEPLSAVQQRAMPADFAASREAHAKQQLSEFAAARGLAGAPVHLAHAPADAGLMKVAERVGADLIVVGRVGRGGAKGHLGSVAARLVRTSPVDVLVVHQDAGTAIGRIGVASDLEHEPEIEVRRGVSLAGQLGLGEVVLLHAYEVPAGHHMIESWSEAVQHLGDVARREAEAVAARAAGPGGPRVRVRVEEGATAAAIAKMAAEEGLDLLVISTHRRTGPAELLLTRTSERIVNRAPCSVWAEKDTRLFQDLRRAVGEWLD